MLPPEKESAARGRAVRTFLGPEAVPPEAASRRVGADGFGADEVDMAGETPLDLQEVDSELG